MDVAITLTINGQAQSVRTDGDRSLLEVLREDLDLTGTKYGCGEGECRTCTVLLDGKAVSSCRTPIRLAEGKTVVTIEGLADDGDRLHLVQEAFLEKDAMQCGYCVPGMILGATALLAENPHPSEQEIHRAMNGNLCRCCGYTRIVEAIGRAAAGDAAPSRATAGPARGGGA